MNGQFRVIYSTESLSDIRDIYSYIANELLVPETADLQVDRIRREIKTLNELPLRYHIVDWEPWRGMRMHQMPVDKYCVFYLVDDSLMTVRITRIVYSGRDLSKIADHSHP